ncbi:MAG: putative dithiol-disulfide isomerase involved in polyketide biosynthesis [Chthonomonadaceae bacterium]|nr:putative dithiol-disulfide isomerase involved in polyketide biosynthesis [Chthonomonadaceae bacterium]
MPRLTVAHDFICPWCWVAWEQAKKLAVEFPTLQLNWVGYELLPEGLEYTPSVPDPNAPKKPRIPSRFELFLLAEGLKVPKRTRSFSYSRQALEGVEFAKAAGKADAYIGAVYHAYWEEDRDIADIAVLADVAEKAGLDVAAFTKALEERTYRDAVVEYDDPAHAAGVWNVPTWMFPEEWVAEQPYVVVREMAERFVEQNPD